MDKSRNFDGPREARAIWYVSPGVAELRAERLPSRGASEALVRTIVSGVSRGTERLIFNGQVGTSEWQRMRAPLQAGDFPFPVKYGYCAVGVVEAGPADLIGRTVFCLHPHQDRFVVSADMLCEVPAGVSPERATLAANMETALNALWDAGAGPADRIVVVGGGVVGLLIGYLAALLPGSEVAIVEIDRGRRTLIERLGCRFCEPSEAPGDADLVFHASATAAGLSTAIACAGLEAKIVELSWYGDKTVAAMLGGAFHSRRLQLVASQVGSISPSRRPRWDHWRRLEAALRLLRDPRLDGLVEEEISFNDAPQRLPVILAADARGLAPIIRYPGG